MEEITLESIQKIVVIDVGHKSKVWLVNCQGQKYALKEVTKQGLNEQEVRFLFNEKEALINIQHQRKVNLIKTLQDSNSIYLLLTLGEGAPLNYVLKQQRIMSPSQVKCIIFKIAEFLQYLHSQQYIYRDLKLSNILYSIQGEITVVDFGHCTQFRDGLCEIAGTRHSMSFEMVQNVLNNQQSYGYAVDWWGLGILTYELLKGTPPFGLTGDDIFDNILQGLDDVDFSGMSFEAQDFIKSLLEPNQNTRLGSRGAQEVLQHAFLQDVNVNIQPNEQQVQVIQNWCEFLDNDEEVEMDPFTDF